jgi:hypothetical protein
MAVACCGDDSRGRRKTGTVVEKKENGGDRGSPMWGRRQHGMTDSDDV